MSLFGSLMGGDFEDDVWSHMNNMNMQMRSMNRLMNSFMPDPMNMLVPFGGNGLQQNAMMERNPAGGPFGGLFGFPAMPNMNRLLNADIGVPNGASYCSSSVITMSSGPDGRPQVYQATSSTKTGPGGIRETRRTVQDSTRGVKKMAIGHHIGDRSHIIEKEQDMRSGQLEEREEFINLEEEEAHNFNREFENRSRMRGQGNMRALPQETLTIEEADDDDDEPLPHKQPHRRQLPALPAPPPPANSSSTLPTPKETTTIESSTMSPSQRANVTATHGINLTNNNNNYLNATPRRAYRSHIVGATSRRPLRTPSSSPLATTPTNHTSTTSTSVHPYATAAARRNFRSKHAKQPIVKSAPPSNSDNKHD